MIASLLLGLVSIAFIAFDFVAVALSRGMTGGKMLSSHTSSSEQIRVDPRDSWAFDHYPC